MYPLCKDLLNRKIEFTAFQSVLPCFKNDYLFYSYVLFIFSSFISYDLPLFNFTFFCGIILSGITRKNRSKYDVTSYTMKYYITISVASGMPSVQDLWSKRYLAIQSGHVARFLQKKQKKKNTERWKNLILMGNIWERAFPYVSFS